MSGSTQFLSLWTAPPKGWDIFNNNPGESAANRLTIRERSRIMFSMNRLTTERRAQILGMMVEGNSIRAISRMTGASKNTIIRLLEDAGEAFSAYQDQAFRDLKLKRIQLDEIWAFCYAKQRNVMLAKAAPKE